MAMNLLMLCREPRLYSCQRLCEAAAARGHQMDILDPNRFLLRLSEAGTFSLYYQATETQAAYSLQDYDGVLPRFGVTSNQQGCAVLEHLLARGAVSLNSPQAFALARDKWQSLQYLAAAGLPLPDSYLSGREVSAETLLAQLSPPLIIKTLAGMQGVGVMLAESVKSAHGLLDFLYQNGTPALQQEFIAEAESADIRAFVVGERVVAAMRRIGKKEDVRANFHRGGRAESVQLSVGEQQLAVAAAKALGLEVAGVDLIPSARGLLVLEVNASPGLEMIEQTSGIDIASEMIALLEKKVKQKG